MSCESTAVIPSFERLFENACRIHTSLWVSRYLLSNTKGRMDGAEKALRHEDLCRFYTAAFHGEDPDLVRRDHDADYRRVHRATQALTDRLDEVIGFPLDERHPRYDELAPQFFQHFHRLALLALRAQQDQAGAKLPAITEGHGEGDTSTGDAPEVHHLNATIWRRESTQEWVLELSGSLDDTAFVTRHTQPLSTPLADVASLQTLYEQLDPPDGYRLLPVEPPDELLSVWLTAEDRAGGRSSGDAAPWTEALRRYGEMLDIADAIEGQSRAGLEEPTIDSLLQKLEGTAVARDRRLKISLARPFAGEFGWYFYLDGFGRLGSAQDFRSALLEAAKTCESLSTGDGAS